MRRYKVTIEGAPSGKALFQDTNTGELYYLGMRIDAREISEGYGFYERPFLASKSGKVSALGTLIEFTDMKDTHELATMDSEISRAIKAAGSLEELKALDIIVTTYTREEDRQRKNPQPSLFDFDSTHNEGQVIKMKKRRKTARKDDTR